eukprot:363882-Chlamydomonas_euryale.AAC.4
MTVRACGNPGSLGTMPSHVHPTSTWPDAKRTTFATMVQVQPETAACQLAGSSGPNCSRHCVRGIHMSTRPAVVAIVAVVVAVVA